MMAEDIELQGVDGIGAVPDWLRGLIRAFRGEAIPPKDPRVKALWNLLRQRQLLSPWMRTFLKRVWDSGLPRRRRRRLRPGVAVTPRPFAPGALRPVRPSVAVRPLRPIATVRPVAFRPVSVRGAARR